MSFHLKAAVDLFCKEGAMQRNIKRTRRLTTSLAFEEAQTRWKKEKHKWHQKATHSRTSLSLGWWGELSVCPNQYPAQGIEMQPAAPSQANVQADCQRMGRRGVKGRETTSQSETFPSTATMGAPRFQKCLPVPHRLKRPVTYAKLLLEGHTETCSDCGSAFGIQNTL